jgi:hypothetical protein
MLRRVLDEFGLAVTFGVEPTTVALDERLASGAEAIGLDSWLLANRVVCSALMAGVPLVVGGEFAAALQGVPIENPHIVVHLRLTDINTFHQVVRAARCTLGVPGSSLVGLEPEDITPGTELTVFALVGTIQVLVVDELPVAKLISVQRPFVSDPTAVDVPVIPLAVLRESKALGATAAALAQRLLYVSNATGGSPCEEFLK